MKCYHCVQFSYQSYHAVYGYIGELAVVMHLAVTTDSTFVDYCARSINT